jgi:hypothetical protein
MFLARWCRFSGAPNGHESDEGTTSPALRRPAMHIANISQKLDVNDRTEAVTKALQKGIIRLR